MADKQAQRTIGVLVGSLRQDSINRRLSLALTKLAPPSLLLEPIPIHGLPMYNQDLDGNPPPQWVEFKARVRAADGLLFLSPEYNRSVPGVLKNAIDIGSRPYGDSAWGGKPGAVITASPSAIGGFGANHHLRQCLVYLDVSVMAQPEAYIGGADKIVDENGDIATPSSRAFLERFMQAFASWVDRTAATPS
jgi:chromate reductase, NAD(P)H dehydrogenase (quinone)